MEIVIRRTSMAEVLTTLDMTDDNTREVSEGTPEYYLQAQQALQGVRMQVQGTWLESGPQRRERFIRQYLETSKAVTAEQESE